MKQNAVIKSSHSGMAIHLNPDVPMEEILSELSEKFDRSEKFWGNASLILSVDGRKLSAREEMDIVNTISEHSHLDILGLIETDEENTERNDLMFRRKYMELNHLTGLFHRGDIQPGEIISVEPSIVVIGDVYEGACVESSGNIVVLGELAGTAKAGCCGDEDAAVVCFRLATDDVSINGVSLKSAGIRNKKSGDPKAVLCENGTIRVTDLKKGFLDALRHKKMW